MKCVMVCAVMGMMTGCAGNKGAAGTSQDTASETRRADGEVSLKDIEGEWVIRSVHGKELPADMERTPFLAFDTEAMRVHGFASCNLVNGAMLQDEGQPASLKLPQMISTMMAGPYLEWEQEVLQATEQVASFALNDGRDTLSLQDADGNEVLCLQKHTGEKLSR